MPVSVALFFPAREVLVVAQQHRQRGTTRAPLNAEWRQPMLWTIAVILLVLWILGFVSAYTMGGFIHILLVFAAAIVLLNLVNDRRAST